MPYWVLERGVTASEQAGERAREREKMREREREREETKNSLRPSGGQVPGVSGVTVEPAYIWTD